MTPPATIQASLGPQLNSSLINFAYFPRVKVASVEDLQQLGTALSLPNQPWTKVVQDPLPSLSISALQCYGSVLSNYEQFVKKDLQTETKQFKPCVTDAKNATKVIKSPPALGTCKTLTKPCVVTSDQNIITINKFKSAAPASVLKTVQIYPQPKQVLQIIPASFEINSNPVASVTPTSSKSNEMFLFPIKPGQISEQSEKALECQNATDSSVLTLANQCIQKDASSVPSFSYSLATNVQHASEAFAGHLDVAKTSYAFQQQHIQQRQMLQLLAKPEVSSDSMQTEKDSL